MKLTSLSKRIDQIQEEWDSMYFPIDFSGKAVNYNDFLKTDLLSNYFVEDQEYHYLNRFVPCTIEGVILDKPFNPNDLEPQENLDQKTALDIIDSWDNYHDRLSKVMFEGFEYKNNDGNYCMIHFKGKALPLENDPLLGYYKTISNLIDLNLTLTPYGAKISGL